MGEKIAQYFYDKTIEFYTSERINSDDGGRGEPVVELQNTIKCNTHFVTKELLKESFGIDINAKLMITCSVNEVVQVGFKFDRTGYSYEVVEVLPSDSHLKILCR